jgi:hypothetical protein
VGEDRFWALIAECRAQEPHDGERLAEVLASRLRQFEPDEILAFGRLWYAALGRLYTWPVWDAAHVLLGWVGDDSFRDVRAWIVTHGRDVVHRIAEDADNLADLAADQDQAFVEAFDGLIYENYRAVAGAYPPAEPAHEPIEPAGERTNLKDQAAVSGRFPRLATLRDTASAPVVPGSSDGWVPDEANRCPRCGQALTRGAVQQADKTAPGLWVQSEFRRCTACLEFACRLQSDMWRSVGIEGVPPSARIALWRG